MSVQIHHHKRINFDADLYDSRWKNIRLPKILINLKLITLPILCNEKWPRHKRAKQSLIFPMFIISSRIHTPIDYYWMRARSRTVLSQLFKWWTHKHFMKIARRLNLRDTLSLALYLPFAQSFRQKLIDVCFVYKL